MQNAAARQVGQMEIWSPISVRNEVDIKQEHVQQSAEWRFRSRFRQEWMLGISWGTKGIRTCHRCLTSGTLKTALDASATILSARSSGACAEANAGWKAMTLTGSTAVRDGAGRRGTMWGGVGRSGRVPERCRNGAGTVPERCFPKET